MCTDLFIYPHPKASKCADSLILLQRPGTSRYEPLSGLDRMNAVYAMVPSSTALEQQFGSQICPRESYTHTYMAMLSPTVALGHTGLILSSVYDYSQDGYLGARAWTRVLSTCLGTVSPTLPQLCEYGAYVHTHTHRGMWLTIRHMYVHIFIHRIIDTFHLSSQWVRLCTYKYTHTHTCIQSLTPWSAPQWVKFRRTVMQKRFSDFGLLSSLSCASGPSTNIQGTLVLY
jgi:hypothetical protein